MISDGTVHLYIVTFQGLWHHHTESCHWAIWKHPLKCMLRVPLETDLLGHNVHGFTICFGEYWALRLNASQTHLHFRVFQIAVRKHVAVQSNIKHLAHLRHRFLSLVLFSFFLCKKLVQNQQISCNLLKLIAQGIQGQHQTLILW